MIYQKIVSDLMLLNLLKYCLLYKETGSDKLKILVNETIDYQLSYKAMSSVNTENY